MKVKTGTYDMIPYGRFRSIVPWAITTLLVIGGCAVTRIAYVKEQDWVTALNRTRELVT